MSKVTRPGLYRITDADGNEVPNSWNIEHLRKFYPSYMVMSVDLFNKSRVPINFSTTLKAVVNLAASHWIIP